MNIISLGAGVQSSTMALMAKHGEITPMPDCAIFADTQAEPKAVYEWLDWLEKQLPFPVLRVTQGNLALDATIGIRTKKIGALHKYRHISLPTFTNNSMRYRYCTREYKIDPIRRTARRLANGSPIVMWIGISYDELSRMRESTVKQISHRYPLVDANIRREHCLKWMADHKYPTPPRSACYFCPFHNDLEWRNLKQSQEWQRIVDFDLIIRTRGEFLHRSKLPIDQVDFSTAEDHGQLNLFENECEGMCGV